MAIIIAAVVLGVAFYAVQYNKQQSIEKQQLLKLREDREQQSLENKRAELKLKQEEWDRAWPYIHRLEVDLKIYRAAMREARTVLQLYGHDKAADEITKVLHD